MTAPTLRLRGYQREAIDAIEKSLTEHTRVACVLPTGAGKGHPLDTDVPTPQGLRKWGDLQVGDYVFGSNGLPTRVTAIFDRGVLPTYIVAFKHGEHVEVDGDHLWQVQRKGRKPRIVTTEELTRLPRKDRDGYCWSTPVNGAVHHPTADLPLHPYVTGSLIANGGMTHCGTLLITSDNEVIDRVRQHVEVRLRPFYPKRTCPTYSLPGLTRTTRLLGMRVHSRDKRIPRLYLEADIPQRLDLLHGLMDGDGSSRPGGRRSGFYSTTSKGLALDVKELVSSLGGTCAIAQKTREHEGKPTEYKCSILMPLDMPMFSTGRRLQSEQPRRAFAPRRPITSVFLSGHKPIRCIAVEAEDSLYCVTRNYIVTHNTVLFSHLAARTHEQGRRTLILVHREELADQARAKIHSVAPHVSTGIVKAERNETDADVIVGSVQTLANPARREALLDRNIGLVVCDEAHHSTARTWMAVLDSMGCFADREIATPAVGFTATLHRTDGVGLGDVWETVAYERDILWMIDNGYLTDVRGQQVTVDGLDLATVARNRGDYAEGQLGEAMEASGAGDVIARAYLEHAGVPGGVKQGVLFAPTVATAYSWAESMREHGIEAATVEGNTPSEERRLIYKRYEAGDIRVLTNAMVLTEGWDAPWAEVAVIARPTQSPSLYTQMVGRVLRPWRDKEEALILDVVGITASHKLQSLTTLLRTQVLDGESYGEARTRLEAEVREGLERQTLAGALRATQVELFANSHSTWLQTREGTWFIPVKAGVFFIWPEIGGPLDGTYRLGYKKQYDRKRVGGPQWGESSVNFDRSNGWIHQGLTLEYAMAWGEELAEADDPTVSLRDRKWRRTKPSQAQIDYAIRLKVAPPDEIAELRKGPLSDLISVAVASKMLDGFRR